MGSEPPRTTIPAHRAKVDFYSYQYILRGPPSLKYQRALCFQVSARAAPSRPRQQEPHAEITNNSDVLGLYSEAQSNIIHLNNSRLKALDELKAARKRISELGGPYISDFC